MPRDSNGVYSLPTGYLAVFGDTIQPSQHNPPLEDMRDALTNSLPRNGAAPMTGALKMGTNKVTGLAPGTLSTDAATFGQTGALSKLVEAIKTDDYAIVIGDAGTALVANKATAITFTLPALAGAATAPYWIRNIGIGDLTLDGNGAETIEAVAAITLRQGDAAFVWPNGATWRAIITRRKATQAEAQIGAATDFVMDPLRVKQSVIFGSGLPGQFVNLVISATSATSVTLTADALTVADASNSPVILRSVNLTADISVTGNRLDGAAEASNAWYEVGVITKADGTTPLLAFLKDGSSPTLPSGYTGYRRFGYVRNDGSSNLWRTIQRGRDVQIIVGANPSNTPIAASGTVGTFSLNGPTLVSVSLTSLVPPNCAVVHIVAINKFQSNSTANILIAPNTAWGGTNNGPHGSNGNIYPVYLNSTSTVGGQSAKIVLETTAVAWASDANGGAFGVLGWELN